MDNSIGIFPRFDYYTIIVYNNCVENCMLNFGIDPSIFSSELIDNTHFIDMGYMTVYRFSVYGVQIELNVRDAGLAPERQAQYGSFYDCIMHSVMDQIRVNFTGTGLDFLRVNGFDVDNNLPLIRPSRYFNFKVTRIDIAFDLLNVSPSFYTDCFKYLNHIQCDLECDRIPLMHRTASICFEVRGGKNRTVYLGSTQGDKLLRIYDKKYQLCPKGLWEKQPPFECDPADIDSWIRIEWQLRRECAENMLFGQYEGNYFLNVFKAIYSDYCFKDLDRSKTNKPVPVDFWENLFDWGSIPKIIQNANCAHVITTPERIDNFVERTALGNLLLYVAVHGYDYLYTKLKERIDFMNDPSCDPQLEVIRQRVNNKFLRQYAELLDVVRNEDLHIGIEHGKLFLKGDVLND